MHMFLVCLVAVSAAAFSAEVRIEAEGTTDAEQVADGWAWGGKAVQNATAWQPLLRATPPADAPRGDTHVWLRHRNGPVNLKVIEGGSQVELGWSWAAAEDFTWAHFGPFPAARIAGGLIVIRDGGQSLAQLDCMVLSDSATVPADPPLTVRDGVEELRIAWDTPVGTTSRFSFGLNLFHAFDPAVQANPVYRANLIRMRPGFIRLHNAGQTAASSDKNGIWDAVGKRIDAAKIRNLCASWRGIAPEILMNITGWPAWMDANHDGLLDEDQIPAYAAACAEFVRLVNIEEKTAVTWWEPMNEKDDLYWPKQMHGDLARIHIACAAAMKAVDPTIQVGGAAVSRPDKRDDIATFVAAAGSSLDFLSWHAYASGSASDSDAHLFRRAVIMPNEAQLLQQRIATVTAPRVLPGFFDEYNVSWTWESRDPRMTNQFSALFDALVMSESAKRGIVGTTAWNECDGIYGKMDNEFKLRPAAEVFTRANRDLIGTIIQVDSGAQAPSVLAIRRADGSRAAMLINTDRRPVRIHQAGDGKRPARLAILDRGVASESASDWSAIIELPGRSVAWLTDTTK